MSSNLIHAPGILMIAGHQQNVGKTTLAVTIIQHFSQNHNIYGLKVSPHIHKNTSDAKLLFDNKNWQLLEEYSDNTKKDTSRMLASGAKRAFLLQGNLPVLIDGFVYFCEQVPKNTLIVCESAGLRDLVLPDIFLVVRQLNCRIVQIEDDKMFQQADRIITFTTNGFDFSTSALEIVNHRWILKKNKI